MLITRTPLRISIGGGGTDLPSYYTRRGGFVISAAISQYIFVGLNHTFTDDYVLKYSSLEKASDVATIKHPLVREAFVAHGVQPGIEMVSLADIPAGTGLGSSGSFGVGLLRAIYAWRREHVTAGALAEEAADIEINRLGEAVGKQDHYIAAFGGLTCFHFHKDGTVTTEPLRISQATLHDLEEHLLLFFTGYSRAASHILGDQQRRTDDGEQAMLDAMDATKELGLEIRAALEGGRPEDFGRLMNDHWMRKRERSEGMSNPDIDRWYQLGLENGAVGGKLVGAGAGGFLLFYARDPRRLREAFASAGMRETRFQFDLDGSVVLVRD